MTNYALLTFSFKIRLGLEKKNIQLLRPTLCDGDFQKLSGIFLLPSLLCRLCQSALKYSRGRKDRKTLKRRESGQSCITLSVVNKSDIFFFEIGQQPVDKLKKGPACTSVRRQNANYKFYKDGGLKGTVSSPNTRCEKTEMRLRSQKKKNLHLLKRIHG